MGQRGSYQVLRIDGSVNTKTRANLVEQFQTCDSDCVFLLSTKATAMGLNLTAANKVIIFDVLWNPSYNQQAIARSYRLGQVNDVEIYRLVTKGTIEENIYLRDVKKTKRLLELDNHDKIYEYQFNKDLEGLEALFKYRDHAIMSNEILETMSHQDISSEEVDIYEIKDNEAI